MSGSPERARRVEVAVVGTVNLDHTVRVPELPVSGETVVGDAVTTALGGKGANQAVAAARLGARTALIGCVGDDGASAELLAYLGAEANLDLVGVRRVAGATGTAYVTIDDTGANTIVSARGVNRALDEDHVHRHGRTIGDASVLLVQLGVPIDAVRAALEIARSVGTITVLDPSPPSDLTDDLLRLVDICTPNASEANRLTGIAVTDPSDARRAADMLLARGCASALITLGERGAYYAAADGPDGMLIPARAVTVVDPTAAGDAFCGALGAALARGSAIDDACAYAAAAGALATTRAGAAPSLATRAEVDSFLGADADRA